jgi:peptide/nickel transport system permease protein
MFRKAFYVAIIALFALIALMPWHLLTSSEMSLAHMNELPSLLHPLGTDNLGRSLLIRIHQAVAFSVIPLWLAVICANFAGVIFALIHLVLEANRFARFPAKAIYLALVTLAGIPIIYILFFWSAASGKAESTSLLASFAAIFGVHMYLTVIKVYHHDRELGYWQAHEALGGSLWQRLHAYGIKKHWRSPLIQTLVTQLYIATTIEASLSYIGFGIQEPAASFGNILASHFDSFLKGHFYVPFVTLSFLIVTLLFPGALIQMVGKRTKSFDVRG